MVIGGKPTNSQFHCNESYWHITISQGGHVQRTDDETKWPTFTDNIFKFIIMNENCLTLIQISLKYVPNGPINIGPILAQMMYSCWINSKPLSEPILATFTDTYIVTCLRWVKENNIEYAFHIFIWENVPNRACSTDRLAKKRTVLKEWISNYTHIRLRGVMIHPYPELDGGLLKMPLK